MRAGLLTATALMALGCAMPVQAGGRSVGDVCISAGFRMGTAAFTNCVAQSAGDNDPLASLGKAQKLDSRSDGKRPQGTPQGTIDPLAIMVPIKPDAALLVKPTAPAVDEIPASFNTGGYTPPTPPPSQNFTNPGFGGTTPLPTPNGWVTPTAPTAPTPPTLPFINFPLWNFAN